MGFCYFSSNASVEPYAWRQSADLTIQAPVLGLGLHPSTHCCWPLEICEPVGVKLLPCPQAGNTFTFLKGGACER